MTDLERDFIAVEPGNELLEPTDNVVVEERVGVIYDEQAPKLPPRGTVGRSYQEEYED